jgi:hypothetical protein
LQWGDGSPFLRLWLRGQGLLDEAADGFRATWEIRLLSAPVIDLVQEFLGRTHLKGSVVNQRHAGYNMACIDMPQDYCM